MKNVTLEEFEEMVKNDENLMAKFKEISETESADLSTGISEIIKEAGFELENEMPRNIEELSDEELELAVGGIDSPPLDSVVTALCIWLYEYLGVGTYENCLRKNYKS